jgi:hypothetical protein
LAALALMFAFGPAGPARAEAIYFTASGTVTQADDGSGYTVGQAVSFRWDLNSNFSKSASSNFSSFVSWGEEFDSDPPLWTNVQGSGVAGTFQQAPANGPNSNVSAYPGGGMWVRLGTDQTSSTKNHGIYLAANPDFFIERIEFDLFSSPLTAPGFNGFAIPSSAPIPAPNDYFAAYLGDYATNFTPGSGFQILARNDLGSYLNAKVAWNSVTIAQVPEPSTFALGGIAMGVMVLIARRRASRRVEGVTG